MEKRKPKIFGFKNELQFIFEQVRGLLFQQIKSTKKDTEADPGGRVNCLQYVPLSLPSGRVLDADKEDHSVCERDFA